LTDERDQDSTNISHICSQWTCCTPNEVANTYIDNIGCIQDTKKAIAETYIAAILAYESALARKSEEKRITKHLTGLTVTTTAEDTEIKLDDFPTVHVISSVVVVVGAWEFERYESEPNLLSQATCDPCISNEIHHRNTSLRNINKIETGYTGLISAYSELEYKDGDTETNVKPTNVRCQK
jgi:hypothetical protein